MAWNKRLSFKSLNHNLEFFSTSFGRSHEALSTWSQFRFFESEVLSGRWETVDRSLQMLRCLSFGGGIRRRSQRISIHEMMVVCSQLMIHLSAFRHRQPFTCYLKRISTQLVFNKKCVSLNRRLLKSSIKSTKKSIRMNGSSLAEVKTQTLKVTSWKDSGSRADPAESVSLIQKTALNTCKCYSKIWSKLRGNR